MANPWWWGPWRFLGHPCSYQRWSLCIQLPLLFHQRLCGSSSSESVCVCVGKLGIFLSFLFHCHHFFQPQKMQSGGPESASPITNRVQSLSSADTRGKHRVHAELKRLEQEARFLEVATYFFLFFFFIIIMFLEPCCLVGDGCCCCCLFFFLFVLSLCVSFTH